MSDLQKAIKPIILVSHFLSTLTYMCPTVLRIHHWKFAQLIQRSIQCMRCESWLMVRQIAQSRSILLGRLVTSRKEKFQCRQNVTWANIEVMFCTLSYSYVCYNVCCDMLQRVVKFFWCAVLWTQVLYRRCQKLYMVLHYLHILWDLWLILSSFLNN